MLRPRIIPCLLVKDGGLVKTVKFGQPKYVGDPINAVRIFNEKEVDELIVVDIDATVDGREPDYELISDLAAECRMPLCYGGGVNSVDQFEKIIGLGVEKVSISSAAIAAPDLISDAAERVGTQSVVVVVDVKRRRFARSFSVVTDNGNCLADVELLDWVRECQARGAGEVVVNAVDRDGLMKGYDVDLVSMMRETIDVPLTILGGAGSHEDLIDLVKRFGIMGVAAGSLFVFKGKLRAVLINYPNREEKDQLYRSAGVGI